MHRLLYKHDLKICICSLLTQNGKIYKHENKEKQFQNYFANILMLKS